MSRHARAGSATRDNQAFRQAIASMRQEVLDSQAETQRMKDQLNCLIMLVRRAWSGDQSAAIHVANVVGVAPPIFQQETEGEDLTALYKSKPVHHWAMLTVGLLNHHYRQLEENALDLAKKRLQQRQEFLEDQLRLHQDILQKPPTVPLKHHCCAETKTQSFFLTSGGTSTTGHHKGFDGRQQPSSLLEPQIPAMHKPKLFEVPAELNNKPKAKRPVSAHQLKKADSQRARPRSAVVKMAVKTERPLKYETTRPTSAKAKTKEITAKSGPPSRNITMMKPTAKENEDHSLDINGNTSKGSGGHWEKEPLAMEESVIEELRKIEKMEEDFEKTTKLLQLKLGISNSGAI